MVFNEGFELFFGKKDSPKYENYFVFLKYQWVKKEYKYKSKCYESMIGWYHIGKKNFGCFKGHKNVKNYSQITNSEVANKYNVLEGSMEKASFIEENLTTSIQTVIDPFAPRFMQKELNDNEVDDDEFDEIKFFEMNAGMKNMNQNQVVEKINNMNLSWKAAEYEEFDGYTYNQIDEFMNNKNEDKFEFSLTKKKSRVLNIFFIY